MLDNQISLTGQATDVIRVRLKMTKQLDIESRIVDSVDVVPIIFPPMVDVPYDVVNDENYHRVNLDDRADDHKMMIQVLPQMAELFPVEIMTSRADKIMKNDLIFRVMLDPNLEYPLVIVLEITQALGTFGTHSIIYSKFNSVFYNEVLPKEMMDYVTATAIRRLNLEW
ncbi:MAG: hypothetical protein LC687_08025 [Actinobacteria bacterium]|nr:hypothetical protein [Actinomycetota bacterium]